MATRNSFYHHALDTYGFSKGIDGPRCLEKNSGIIKVGFAGESVRFHGHDGCGGDFDTGLLRLSDLELDHLLRILIRNNL